MSSAGIRLFICEKPSQGKDIARVLGAQRRGEGYYSGENVVLTWCIGHLIESAEPAAYGDCYKRWSIEHLPIIPDRWQLEIKPSTSRQFKVIQSLLSRATDVVIATDADREGEMIAREILEVCRYRGPVLRLWLSALNDASIRQALGALRPGIETLPLYHAGLARSRADWLVGMNLTRLFTLLGRRAGHDAVLSVGRVQTPTLRLVVERDREIAAFVPAPYWVVEVGLSAGGQPFQAHWMPPAGCHDEAGRCINDIVAQAAAGALRGARCAQVLSVHTEPIREAPPLPFDLGTLQTVCSRALGLDVQQTLDIAQALYETHKATTYPRSDCRYLPENMLPEVPVVLRALVTADPTLQPLFGMLNPTQRSRAWDNSKITAHHAIIPTLEPPQLSRLSVSERAVYDLIRAHYLAQFLPHYEYERTIVRLACAQQNLQARGRRIVARGWHIVLTGVDEDDAQETQRLPELAAGAPCDVGAVDLKALKTVAPKPFTQGELISAMKGIAKFVKDPALRQVLKDATGIGTEATRASIIEGLITRGYLLKQGRRALHASSAAFTLIDAIPEAVADPVTNALWELSLNRIAMRQMSLDEFVRQQSAWVSRIVQDYAHTTLPLHGSRR